MSSSRSTRRDCSASVGVVIKLGTGLSLKGHLNNTLEGHGDAIFALPWPTPLPGLRIETGPHQILFVETGPSFELRALLRTLLFPRQGVWKLSSMIEGV